MDFNTLIIYPRLSRKGQLSLIRQRRQYGKPHNYYPQGRTLYRIASELDWTIDRVANQLAKEKTFLWEQDFIPSMGWYRGQSHSIDGY